MAERLRGGGPFEARAAYCRAVRAGPLVAVSGCAPIGPDGALLHPGDTEGQTAAAIGIGLAAVSSLGGTRESVIRSRVFLVPEADWEGAVRAHADAFGGVDPANTTLYVHGFIPPGVLVEVELDAYVE